jgi:hypothetical protein
VRGESEAADAAFFLHFSGERGESGTVLKKKFGFHGMIGTSGTKMEIFYLISQSDLS